MDNLTGYGHEGDDTDSSTASRKPQYMAFTIHFDCADRNSVNNKVINHDLKHRRNQSLSSTTEVNKTKKGEVNSALAVSSSVLSATRLVPSRQAEYHSEGYFSGDQEEDRNKKAFFVRKLKNFEKGLRTTNLAQEKINMADQTSHTKLNNSPHLGRHEFGDFQVVEDTKLKSRLDELKYLHNAPYKSFKDDELAKDEWLQSSSPQTPDDLVLDYEEDDNELFNDTASEAGTYTIERDVPCIEEDQARQEVDIAVAGVSCSNNDFKMSSCRNGSGWINDWATQVAKHNHQLEPEKHTSGLPMLPHDKHKGSTSITTRIPSPIHSPTLPPSGRRPGRPPHHNPSDETESYLRATESVVTAMQARMSLSRESGSDSDMDMPRLAVQRQASGASDKRRGQSDSGSEASDVKPKKEEPLLKYNRAFSLRRARLNVDPHPTPAVDSRRTEPVASSVSKSKKSGEPGGFQPRTTKSSSPKQEPAKPFSRTDCGRFSIRTTKTTAQQSVAAKSSSPVKGEVQNCIIAKKSSGRSNSTLSSREVEFLNWKRRKSYDPMKAAAEGKKKDMAKKATFHNSMTQSYIATEELSPSHQSTVLRSASFHGTLGMKAAAPNYLSSEEEATGEEDEDSPTNKYHTSLAPVMGSPTKSACDGAIGGSRVSLHSTASNSSIKGRIRPEALDSLVMSALCGISTKLRGHSCILLKKLRYLYEEDVEKSEQLSAIIDLLECPANPESPQNKSQSKELSETLKNMKRLESVFNVLDEVLFDDEDLDEDLNGYNFQ